MKRTTLRNPQDAVVAAIFIAIGLAGLAISLGYPMGTLLRMGPGYFPSIVFSGLAIVGIIVGIGAVRFHGPKLEPWNIWAVLSVLGAVVVFALAVRPLGFLAAIVLAVVVSGLAHPPLRIGRLLMLGVGLAIAAALIFVVGLGLPIRLWP